MIPKVCVFKSTKVAEARSLITCCVFHTSFFRDQLLSGCVALLSQWISISASQSARSASVFTAVSKPKEPTFTADASEGKARAWSSLRHPGAPRIYGVFCRNWVDWNISYFVIWAQKNVVQRTCVTFLHQQWTHSTGFTVHQWRPLQLVRFCTCLATETKSDSAARLRFNISPLGKWRLIFPSHSTFMIFFSIKTLAEVRCRWSFSMFACWAGGDLGRAQTFWHTAWKYFRKSPK